MVTLNVPNCPTMLVGPSGVGDRGEKGDVIGCIDALLGVDDGSIVSVGIRGVNGGDKIEGHSVMVGAVAFLTEVGMFKAVGVGNVDSGSRGKRVVFKGREDVGVVVDECPKVGRGHDGGESSTWRVLILLEVF